MAEWRLGMWSNVDANGKMIDMEAIFRPKPAFATVLIKAVFCVWVTAVMIHDLVIFQRGSALGFWFVYLSNWGVLLTSLYLAASIIRILFPLGTTDISLLTRFAWGLFSVVVNMELVITVLYWALDYNPVTWRTNYDTLPLKHINLMKHVGILVVLWIDGFVIHRLPLRLQQILWFGIFTVSYVIWLGIHAVKGIGNPRLTDTPDGDDDAIYVVVNWSERPIPAGIVSGIVVFVVLPMSFLLSWGLSFVLGRRYKQENTSAPSTGVETEENERTKRDSWKPEPTEVIPY